MWWKMKTNYILMVTWVKGKNREATRKRKNSDIFQRIGVIATT